MKKEKKMEKDKMVKLGLIQGRHEMPVDDYLVKVESIPDSMLSVKGFSLLDAFVQGAVDRVINDDYPGIKEVELYLTGLSRVQHLAIKKLLDSGVAVSIYDYDRDNNTYFKLLEYNPTTSKR